MFQKNFKESQQPHAVLIGLDSLQGLQAARILARHNVPIIALTNDPNHHCSRTNVCQKKIYSETIWRYNGSQGCINFNFPGENDWDYWTVRSWKIDVAATYQPPGTTNRRFNCF